MSFQVGDHIRGLEYNGYAITNQTMTEAVVTELSSGRQMWIEILAHEDPDFVGDRYKVDNGANRFALVTPDVREGPDRPTRAVVEGVVYTIDQLTEVSGDGGDGEGVVLGRGREAQPVHLTLLYTRRDGRYTFFWPHRFTGRNGWRQAMRDYYRRLAAAYQ